MAHLARLDPKLLYPVDHRGEDSQAHLAVLRSREALVGARTKLVNHVRGTVKSFGGRLPKCTVASLLSRATATWKSRGACPPPAPPPLHPTISACRSSSLAALLSVLPLVFAR